MGQGVSYDTGRLYLNILNCSNKTFWVNSVNGWDKLLPDHRLRAIEVESEQELDIYNFDRSAIVTHVTLFSSDMLLYMKGKGAHLLNWPVPSEFQRPFYLIAHQLNDPTTIEPAVFDGANACEIDAVFDEEHKDWYVNHDLPTGLTITQWFQHVKPHAEIQLVIVDTKTPCPGWKLHLLLEQIRKAKYKHAVVISVATEVSCLMQIEKKLHANEGLATDYLSVTKETMGQLPKDGNLWYGNGVSSSLNKPGLYQSIRDAVFIRTNGHKIKKVYAWTFNSEDTFLKFLDTDLDGIMVEKEFVGQARALVEQTPFFRMATLKDDPFHRSEVGCKTLTRRNKKTSHV